MARIADSGWLMIGMPNSSPKMPGLVSVKVDPPTSSGDSFFVRARPARSLIVSRNAREVALLGLAHGGHNQSPLQRHRDTEIDVCVVVNALFSISEAFTIGKSPQRLNRRHRDKRHVGKLHAVALLKPGLLALAQARNRASCRLCRPSAHAD